MGWEKLLVNRQNCDIFLSVWIIFCAVIKILLKLKILKIMMINYEMVLLRLVLAVFEALGLVHRFRNLDICQKYIEILFFP